VQMLSGCSGGFYMVTFASSVVSSRSFADFVAVDPHPAANGQIAVSLNSNMSTSLGQAFTVQISSE